MPEVAGSSKRLLSSIAILILAAMACNLPDPTASPTPPATDTITPSPTSKPIQPKSVAPETVPAIVVTGASGDNTEAPLPTFTPIQPPTLAPTPKSSNTPIPKPTSSSNGSATRTPRESATPTAGGGALTFDYHVQWRFKDASAHDSIATVTISADGGGGGYQYFRDELPVEGPVFEYVWRSCSGNPGSFRVTSADGQSVVKNYFENPPCPTSTPSP